MSKKEDRTMLYYITYKGKKLSSPLSQQEAEQKLLVLSRCFKQLEIIKELASSARRITVKERWHR
jgi:predicted P-loop ATPase/GTPase